jgi:hypothetical protein
VRLVSRRKYVKGGQRRRRHTRRGRSKENFRCRMVTVTDARSCRQTEWARVAHRGGLQWCRRYGGGSLRTARMGCVSAVGGLGRATAQGGSGFHDRRQANTKASNKCWALLRHRQGQGQGESGSDDRAWVGVQSVVSRRAPETRIIIVARRLLVLVAWLARWVLQYYYYRLTNHWTTDGRAR